MQRLAIAALPAAHFDGLWLVCRCRRKLAYGIVAVSMDARAYCRSCRRWYQVPTDCAPGA